MTFPTPLHSNCPSPTIRSVAAPLRPAPQHFGSLKRSHNLHYPSNFVLHKGNTFYVGDYVYFTSLKGPPLRTFLERKIQVSKSSSNFDDSETSANQAVSQASPVVEYQAFGIVQKFTIDHVMKKVSLLVVLPGCLSRGILQPEDFTLTAKTVEICADQIMSVVCSPARSMAMSVPATPSSSHYFQIYLNGCVPHLSASVQTNLHSRSVSAGPSTETFPRSLSRSQLFPRSASSTTVTVSFGPLFGSCQDAQSTASTSCSPSVEPASVDVAGSSRCMTPVIADIERVESAAKRIKLETTGGKLKEVSEKFEVANVLLGFHKSPMIM